MKRPEDTHYPTFGEINHVIVIGDFAVLVYSTIRFNHHYYSYEVCSTNTYSVLLLNQLALYQVFHKYTVNSTFFIFVRSCDHIEFFAIL